MRQHLDRAESRQIENEYFSETLSKVCSPCEFEDFKEWIIEESDWNVFEPSNHSWINKRSLKVISTETLYKKYLDARESENSAA